MTKQSSYLLLPLFLIVNSCSPSLSQSTLKQIANDQNAIKTSRTKVITVEEKKEIIEWKKALESETLKLVKDGHEDLEKIISIVSKNTHELEKPALKAYITKCIKYSQFGNELAIEAVKELDPELEQFNQTISEQVNEKMENSCQAHNQKNFSKRKYSLIEKYFNNAKEENTNSI